MQETTPRAKRVVLFEGNISGDRDRTLVTLVGVGQFCSVFFELLGT